MADWHEYDILIFHLFGDALMKLSKPLLLTVFVAFVFFTGDGFTQSNATLILKVTGFQNYNGTVNIALFKSADGFPESSENAIERRITQLSGEDPVIEFPGLSDGEYAVSLYHDENSNQRLDKNWLGIPKEGVGFAHNPKTLRRSPSFEEAKFSFNSTNSHITIKLIY